MIRFQLCFKHADISCRFRCNRFKQIFNTKVYHLTSSHKISTNRNNHLEVTTTLLPILIPQITRKQKNKKANTLKHLFNCYGSTSQDGWCSLDGLRSQAIASNKKGKGLVSRNRLRKWRAKEYIFTFVCVCRLWEWTYCGRWGSPFFFH